MRFLIITLVLYTCIVASVADIGHVKAAKSKLISRLVKGKHHKRGILSPIPTYKVGHDIPHVTHSLLKPLVVTYPPTATVSAVKIPLSHPHFHHTPVGHKVHGLPHPHFGLKFPHTKFIKSDQHFHHHHHHVAPNPVVPVAPAPIPPPVPVVPHAAPVTPLVPIAHSTSVSHSVHVPALPEPVVPAHPLPLPAPPVLLQNHLKPLLPAAAVAFPSAPAIPRIPYVIRPGGAVQTSVFATYPRYPLLNGFQAPLLPFSPVHGIQSIQQVLYPRQVPHFNIFPQAAVEHGVLEHHTPNLAVDQTPLLHSQPDVNVHPNQLVPQPHVHVPTTHLVPQPESHLHPNQFVPQPDVHLHPNALVPQPQDVHYHSTQLVPQPELHIHPTQETIAQTPYLHPSGSQPGVHLHPTHQVSLDHDGWSPVPSHSHEAHPDTNYPQPNYHFTQEQGNQVYEHHTENQYPNLHQLQHHIQQQIEQAQYEQSLNNQQHIQQEYGAPQQEYGQPNEHSQTGQDFAQHAHDFHQLGQDFLQQGQGFGHNEYDLANHGQEYGVPHQGVESRSEEDNNQQFHNHIPLALQPPLDRPLEHFR